MQRAPTEFMCLMLKLLQLQPEKEIIVEFIKNEDYKYVRVLGEAHTRLQICTYEQLYLKAGSPSLLEIVLPSRQRR